MASLWKTATPSQYRMLRIIAGAVKNTADAHNCPVPENFARSVAKRATGTLMAQWPDVLAAKSRQKADGREFPNSCRRGSEPVEDRAKGGRPRIIRRPPIRALWGKFASRMREIKINGTQEELEAHVKVLRLLDEAARELEKLSAEKSS